MKKIVLVLLTFILAFSILSCASENGDAKEDNDNADTDANVNNNDAEGVSGNIEWVVDGKELIISGTGKMNDYGYEDGTAAPWNDYVSEVENIIINEGVTSVGSYAFGTAFAAKSVILPNSIESIGSGAFGPSITSINFGSNVSNIDNNAFTSCFSLGTIIVNAENEYYAAVDGVLYDKSVETLIYYPKSKNSNNFIIPDTVKTIGSSAFNFANVSELIIPDSVTAIESDAFGNCSYLEHIELSENLERIGFSSFGNCVALKNVYLPDSLSDIDKSAFLNCKDLVIVCTEGSYAEEYAIENEIEYMYD